MSLGKDLAIYESVQLVAEAVSLGGEILRDTSKRDGTPRKPNGGQALEGAYREPSTGLRKAVAGASSGSVIE